MIKDLTLWITFISKLWVAGAQAFEVAKVLGAEKIFLVRLSY